MQQSIWESLGDFDLVPLLSHVACPTLIVHGTDDDTVPYNQAPVVYGHAKPPKFLVTMVDAPHTFFKAPWLPVHWKVLVDFFDKYLKGKADGLTRLEHDAVNDNVSWLTEAA